MPSVNMPRVNALLDVMVEKISDKKSFFFGGLIDFGPFLSVYLPGIF